MIKKLASLKIEEEGIITKIEVSNKIVRRHLLDMGLIIGTKVRIKKIAPMGDPIDIELRGYELCIRREDLEQILVEVI